MGHGDINSVLPPVTWCTSPLLDLDGLCHCVNHQLRHVPVLQPLKGKSYPPCREPSFCVLYIDDALVASTVRLDYELVPLLPTDGPHGRLGSCGLGLPGARLQLEHRLRDVGHNARAIGMKLNESKKSFVKNSMYN